MDDKLNDSGLPLPDLQIENFRGIKKLTIPRLGRVTLLAGRNGVGKTTVLDAIGVYAARGRHQVLAQVLDGRDEIITPVDRSAEDVVELDWTALFHNRIFSEEIGVSIGSRKKPGKLTIEVAFLPFEQTPYALGASQGLFPNRARGDGVPALKVSSQDHCYYLLAIGMGVKHEISSHDLPPPIEHEVVGPGVLTRPDVARLWDQVALTDDEELITRSIGLIYGIDVSRVAMVGDDPYGGKGVRRRAIVKLQDHKRPVPLRSLGEGASRLFGVALALANCRDGFLLIDEAENGVHYSVQQEFWRSVLQTAREKNVQVIATTHSWDCIAGFARAAVEDKNSEGVLVRLDKIGDQLRAVEYSEEDMETAANQDIEVR